MQKTRETSLEPILENELSCVNQQASKRRFMPITIKQVQQQLPQVEQALNKYANNNVRSYLKSGLALASKPLHQARMDGEEVYDDQTQRRLVKMPFIVQQIGSSASLPNRGFKDGGTNTQGPSLDNEASMDEGSRVQNETRINTNLY